MEFFLADSGQWPVAGTNDRVIGQREDTRTVGAQRLVVIHHAAAHGTGKQRIADNGKTPRQAGHHEGGASASVAAGAPRFDFERAEDEGLSVREGVGAGEWFTFADE